jgi:hypothetical protein
MRWAGHVASIAERRNAYIIWLENLKEGDHLEDLITERRWEAADWIHLAQDREQWRTR